jgi:hypothetical protein
MFVSFETIFRGVHGRNKHEYGTANETLKLLKPCNKGLKINCWESFYIQIYCQRNRLITEQLTGDYNPLYE